MNWPTPRDLLAIDPNPARIKVRDIMERFGICKGSASKLRKLACQAPEVLARHDPARR